MGNIDWSSIVNASIYEWSIDSPEQILENLTSSKLNNYSTFLIQMGYGEPICEIDKMTLFEDLESFLFVSNEGFPLATPDGLYVLEVLSKPEVIYTNAFV